MEISLSITILVLVCAVVYLGKYLIDLRKIMADYDREYRNGREELIKQHILDREKLAKEFDNDRKVLTDRLFVRNGASPIYQERKEPEPFVIESVLNKNARLKREKSDRPTIGVK